MRSGHPWRNGEGKIALVLWDRTVGMREGGARHSASHRRVTWELVYLKLSCNRNDWRSRVFRLKNYTLIGIMNGLQMM